MAMHDVVDRVIRMRDGNQNTLELTPPFFFDFRPGELLVDGVPVTAVPVFNVRDYGAKGDGTTNDYAAIMLAVVAAGAAGGGIVYFPPGTYRNGTNINTDVYDNIHFLGAGRNLTIIKPVDAAAASPFNIVNDYCSVRHLTCNGNRGSGISAGQHGLRIQGVGHVIEDVDIIDAAGYGLAIGQGAHTSNMYVNGLVVTRTGADGIDIKNNQSDNVNIVLENVRVEDAGINDDNGKASIDCRGPVLLNNITIQMGPTSILKNTVGVRFRQDTDGADAGAKRARLSNAIIMGVDGSGVTVTRGVDILNTEVALANVYVEGANIGIRCEADSALQPTERTSLTNCHTVDCLESGFRIGSNAVLTNCHDEGSPIGFWVKDGEDDVIINGFSARGSATAAVQLGGDRPMVSNGKIFGSTGTGILIDSSCDAPFITNVDLSQFSGTKITNGGTNAVLWNNPGIATSSTMVDSKTIMLSGGGATIATGIQEGDVTFQHAANLLGWRIVGKGAESGSIVIDIWKDTYANYQPTVLDTITASAKPTVTTATKNESTTLTGWTTAIAAGDVLRFNVDSVTTFTGVSVTLWYTRGIV